MSLRQQVMMGLLAITLVAVIGMTAARDFAPRMSGPGLWVDPNAPDDLLAARLNVTNIVRTPRSR
jgi:hypothetical protein